MCRRILSEIFPIFFLVLLTVSFSEAQSDRTYVVEGAVVAFQKVNRCPACEGSRGIGIQIENWIVRIDDWKDESSRQDKYILIKYQIYSRSLSETEINKKVKFNLRELQEHEKGDDCVGTITFKQGSDYFQREVKFDDYALTEQGKSDDIPSDFKKLPCFIVEKRPVVLE